MVQVALGVDWCIWENSLGKLIVIVDEVGILYDGENDIL